MSLKMNGVFSHLFVLLPISVAALIENGVVPSDVTDFNSTRDSYNLLKMTESLKQDINKKVRQSRIEGWRFHPFEGPQGGHFDKRPIIIKKYRPSIIDPRTRGNLFRRPVIDVPFQKSIVDPKSGMTQQFPLTLLQRNARRRWKRSGHLKENEDFRRERQRLFESFIGPKGGEFDKIPIIRRRYGASIIDIRTANSTLSARRTKSNGSRLKKLRSRTTSPEPPMTTGSRAASRKSSGRARKTTSRGGARKTTSSRGARKPTSRGGARQTASRSGEKRTTSSGGARRTTSKEQGKRNRRTKRFVRNHAWRDIIRQSVMMNPSKQFETGNHGEADFLKWTLLNWPFQQSYTDHTTKDRLSVSIKIVGPIHQRLSEHRPMFVFRNSIIGPSKGFEQTKNIEGLQNELGPISKHSILKSDVLTNSRTANSDLPFTKPKTERVKSGDDFTYQVANSMIDPRTVDMILIKQDKHVLNE